MSRRSRRLTVAPLLAVALAASVCHLAHASFADDSGGVDVRLDSQRSRGTFQVKVMWLLSVSGRFGAIHGDVHVDAFRNQASVTARIDVSAIRMSSTRYEDWVKSTEFFDAAQYPQIEFVSEPFARVRLRNGGELPGTLTLHGVRQPVRFQLQPSDCTRPAYDCPIEVAGTIRRSAFGMHAHHTTLGDKVELRFAVYALAPPAAANGALPPPSA